MPVEELLGPVPREWTYTTLGAACESGDGNIQTGPFGSQLHASDYVAVGTPSIMPKNIGDNRVIEDGIARITPADAKRLSRYLVREGDIVYSRRGDVERRALIRAREDGWLCGTGCLRVRLGETGVDPVYASLYLGHPSVREWVVRHAHGATMPNLNTSILSACPFVVPPKSEQRAIAAILGALDDKIELNRRMSRTLEEMAQAIFKSWFVDFDGHDDLVDSDLGLIPRGWEVGSLSELAELQTASINPGGSPDKLWEHYSIPAFDEGQNPSIDLGETIKSNKYRVDSAAVLVSKLNPQFPRVWMPNVRDPDAAVCSTEFMPFVPKKPAWRSFLFEFMRSAAMQDTIQSRVTGTTGSRQRVRPWDIAEIAVVLPPEGRIDEAVTLLEPLHLRTLHNVRESRTLTELRDTLLPMLISGELRVRGAPEIAEGVE